MANPMYGQNKADSEIALSADQSTYHVKFTDAGGAVDSKAVRFIEVARTDGVCAITGVRGDEWAGQLVIIKNTSASGTQAHTVTLSQGTWDGSNTVVTLNAANECIMCMFDMAGNGTIVENVGSVALS